MKLAFDSVKVNPNSALSDKFEKLNIERSVDRIIANIELMEDNSKLVTL